MRSSLLLAFVACATVAACSGGGSGDDGGGNGTPTPTSSPSPSPTNTPVPTPTVVLSVQAVGPGSITSDPAGVSCPGDCEGTFDEGSSVTLNAAPDAGAAFQAWFDVACGAGAACALVLDSSASAEALFRCDPVAPSGCGASEGCRLGTYRSVTTASCGAAGAGTQGTACADDTGCADGYACVDPGGGDECLRYCVVGGAACGVGTCTAFNPARIIGATEYGVCL